MTPKGSLVTNSLHSNLHNNDSTPIIDKKTLFGVHAQVSYIYIYIYMYVYSPNKDFSQGRGSYLVSIVILLYFRIAGRQVPRPRCLSLGA